MPKSYEVVAVDQGAVEVRRLDGSPIKTFRVNAGPPWEILVEQTHTPEGFLWEVVNADAYREWCRKLKLGSATMSLTLRWEIWEDAGHTIAPEWIQAAFTHGNPGLTVIVLP